MKAMHCTAALLQFVSNKIREHVEQAHSNQRFILLNPNLLPYFSKSHLVFHSLPVANNLEWE